MLAQHLKTTDIQTMYNTSTISSLLHTNMPPINNELGLAPTVQLCEWVVIVKPWRNVNQFRSRMKQSLAFKQFVINTVKNIKQNLLNPTTHIITYINNQLASTWHLDLQYGCWCNVWGIGLATDRSAQRHFPVMWWLLACCSYTFLWHQAV